MVVVEAERSLLWVRSIDHEMFYCCAFIDAFIHSRYLIVGLK
jgi:hypothetical protein